MQKALSCRVCLSHRALLELLGGRGGIWMTTCNLQAVDQRVWSGSWTALRSRIHISWSKWTLGAGTGASSRRKYVAGILFALFWGRFDMKSKVTTHPILGKTIPE